MLTLYLNPAKSPAALQAKATGSLLSSLRLKRGATIDLSVILLGVTAASDLKLGIKAKDAYSEDLLALATAASGTATEEGLRFDMTLEVSSTQLNDALKVGSGQTEPATLACIAEFSWLEAGALRLSDTLSTTILNDIIRLAPNPPTSTETEYPAADLLATKTWVRGVHASASEYGLVLLETDEKVLSDDHAAVGLTSAGTLAVPAATMTKRGAVKLGTDTIISGSGVLPVGETTSGKMAVSASGMTAYALAKENGYTGTETEWLASLKGEQGEKGDTGRGLFEPVAPQPLTTETALVNGEIYTLSQSSLPATTATAATGQITIESFVEGVYVQIGGVQVTRSSDVSSIPDFTTKISALCSNVTASIITEGSGALLITAKTTGTAGNSITLDGGTFGTASSSTLLGGADAHAAGTYADLSKLSIGAVVTTAEIWIDCTSDSLPEIVWPTAWNTSAVNLRAHVLNKLRVVNDGVSVRVATIDEAGACIVGQQTVSTGLSNYNCYWWRLAGIYNQGGSLRKLTLPTRTTSTNGMPTEPLYLSVWYEDTSGNPVCVGRSLNAVTFAINSTLVWEFADLVLPEGRAMRFCPLKTSSVKANSELLWETSTSIGVQCASRPSGDTVSTANGSSAGAYTVDCTLYMPLSSLSSYVKRSEVAELITNKAALLALLNTSATSES